MPKYETIVILDPSLPDESQEQWVSTVTETASREGGQVLDLQRWGKKRLAYEIKKRREGSYIYFILEGSSKIVRDLERLFRISEEVLKFLTVKIERPKERRIPPEKVARPGEEMPLTKVEEES